MLAAREAQPDPNRWSERFEQCLAIENIEIRQREIFALTQAFAQVASMYGKVICSERWLPDTLKSVKPVSLGGVAGGSKYLMGGILFKFSQDVELSPGVYLYGGTKMDEVAAQKAAGHELKSTHVIMKAAYPEIRVPLMTVVDFRGSRLTCQSVLPIDHTTLIYGSANYGRTIFGAEHSRLGPIVEKLSLQLGLARHSIRDAQGVVHQIVPPVDIEVHQPKDSECAFIIDTARLMPATAVRLDHPYDVFSAYSAQSFCRASLLRADFHLMHKQVLG